MKKIRNKTACKRGDKKNKKLNSKKIFIVAGILLYALVVLSVFFSLLQSQNYYMQLYEKSGIFELVDESEAGIQAKNIIDYFFNDDKFIESDFFNEKERLHMLDVKEIMNVLMIFSLVLFSLAFFYMVFLFINSECVYELTEKIRKILLNCFKTAVVTSALAVMFSTFFFTDIFFSFHEIVFRNDLWLMDPLTDRIILLFPEKFFQLFFTHTMFAALCIAGLLFGIISLIKIFINKLTKRFKNRK